MLTISSEDILDFWFGDQASPVAVNEQKKDLWWAKNDHADAEIRKRFESVCNAVASGELGEWKNSARGMLATIVCLDQFPRNIYRGDSRSFAWDPMALACSRELIKTGMDHQLPAIQRLFGYLPLEHSESLADQDEMVRLTADLRGNVEQEARGIFDGFHDYALRHREVIAKFGRFPHRNEILGRTSTHEELVFLSKPGSSF